MSLIISLLFQQRNPELSVVCLLLAPLNNPRFQRPLQVISGPRFEAGTTNEERRRDAFAGVSVCLFGASDSGGCDGDCEFFVRDCDDVVVAFVQLLVV